MISSANRFHGLGSLRFVYRQGKTVRGPHLSLKYALNPQRANFRCAVVVSKRVNKSAVVRNRIRRRVYEAVRLQTKAITQPYDLVITLFSEAAATMPATELQTAITDLLKRARVIG